jgi:hypothetical protein
LIFPDDAGAIQPFGWFAKLLSLEMGGGNFDLGNF